MQMADILHQIGTPLQFAALFLLLVAGIARLALRTGAWRPTPTISKLVINRIFQAGVVALLLGVASGNFSPLLEHWLPLDETFHGRVLSVAGDPISGASVSLGAIATVPTNELGQFDLVVPRSRVRKDYSVEVRAPGYETLPTTSKTDAEMRDAEFRLKPAPADIVKKLEPSLIVAQYFGAPIVIASFRVENAKEILTPINDIHATLSNGDADTVLGSSYWTIVGPFGPFYPVTGPFPIPAKTNMDLRVVLTPGMNFAGLGSQLSALPEYRKQWPCTPNANGASDPMSDQAFEINRKFAEDHFVWRAGSWRLKVDVAAESERKSFEYDFALSDAEVKRLLASIALIKQCMGTNLASPIAQDGPLANFLAK
jgi:hypothetical protein